MDKLSKLKFSFGRLDGMEIALLTFHGSDFTSIMDNTDQFHIVHTDGQAESYTIKWLDDEFKEGVAVLNDKIKKA